MHEISKAIQYTQSNRYKCSVPLGQWLVAGCGNCRSKFRNRFVTTTGSLWTSFSTHHNGSWTICGWPLSSRDALWCCSSTRRCLTSSLEHESWRIVAMFQQVRQCLRRFLTRAKRRKVITGTSRASLTRFGPTQCGAFYLAQKFRICVAIIFGM